MAMVHGSNPAGSNASSFEAGISWMNVFIPPAQKNSEGNPVTPVIADLVSAKDAVKGKKKSPKNIPLVASKTVQLNWHNAMQKKLDDLNIFLAEAGEEPVDELVLEGAVVIWRPVKESEELEF